MEDLCGFLSSIPTSISVWSSTKQAKGFFLYKIPYVFVVPGVTKLAVSEHVVDLAASVGGGLHTETKVNPGNVVRFRTPLRSREKRNTREYRA